MNNSSKIKEQLALITLLVFLAGIISTESYYSAFGVKYQFLSLPTHHLIYRGITLVITEPYIIVGYCLAVVWLNLNEVCPKQFVRTFGKWNGIVSFAIIATLICLTYHLGVAAGFKGAERDMADESSLLPKIMSIETSTGGKDSVNPYSGYRLLMLADSYIILFKPIPKELVKDAKPHVVRLRTEEAKVIKTE